MCSPDRLSFQILLGHSLLALIGYMRVSKADGSRVLDLQKDALRAAGLTERHLSRDTASGKKDDRPGSLHASRRLGRGTRSRLEARSPRSQSAAPRQRRP